MLFAACSEPIQVYDAPKEPMAKAAPAAPAGQGGGGQPQMPLPDIKWGGLPAGWTETEGEGSSAMRVATFQVKSADGLAELRAIPIPGRGMDEKRLVNMWREQIGQAAITDEEFKQISQPVVVGKVEGTLFDISTGNDEGQDRIMVAMVWDKGFTWFFKFQGDTAVIGKEKSSFVNFLGDLKFETRMPQATQSRPPESAGRPKWKTPPHWEDLGAGMMQLAKFKASGEGGDTEISVSQLGGPAGGIPANVNRWRGQLGMGSVSDADAVASAKSFTVPTGDAQLVELLGDSKSMTVIMVAQGGSTWFFKSFGSKAAVEREKNGFVEFVKSVQYN
ncbi:MAG: hypothetical protein ACI9OD_001856 [Limisphaerales bacterium]|jgi:hypothetical protein